MRKSKHRKSKKSITSLIYLFLLFSILLFSFILIKVGSLGKFIFVNNVDGNAEITVVHSDKLKVVRILILGDTQIKVSRGFGTYKISSLWKLGEKEGYGGKLVVESVRKSFLLPLYLWKDGTKTNLNIWQRIKILFLEKKISGGTKNLIINSKIPESILINFVDPNVAETIFKIEIEDLTGNISVTEDVSKILEIMGVQITSYSKGFDENLDCEVIGKDKKLIKVVRDTFDCKTIIDESLLVDLKIRLGKRLVDRF